MLFAHGLCVSYDRVLHFTQGLGEASIQLFENEDAVVPGNLRKGIFTVGAKYNIDKNSTCTISKSHYHGTSISLFQFLTIEKIGTERDYVKFVNIPSGESKGVRELPSFFSDVKEIKDSPKTFYAPLLTVNIPDHMIDSTEILKIARIDEFQWLQFVSDLDTFEPYTSWSVYHSRKDVVQGREKCVNSILPLLPQNVATLSMQKHCIEVTKAATELLNPGEVIVDVSDQPLCFIKRNFR